MSFLLAKSLIADGEPVTISKHTKDVCDAALVLFGDMERPSRLGECWLRFFRLDPDLYYLPFARILLAACLFHDWGKANQGMQDVLTKSSSVQIFRHEHLSVLMLAWEGVDCWVRQRTDIDWDIVLAAVGSHHLKFSDAEFAAEVPDTATQLLTEHDDFRRQLLPMISQLLKLSGSPQFPNQRFWGFANDVATFNPSELRERIKFERLRQLTIAGYDIGHPRSRMLRAVRSALVAADAAGSGLRRTGQSVIGWVRDQFIETELCNGPLVDRIIQDRIDDLNRRGKWKNWNEFQTACDTLPSRSLLVAPCGSGKTLAAWRWIAAQVKKRPVKRVLFLYPTRATATEGFKDYVSWAPEADAALMHGAADYDLDEMFAVEDPRSGKIFNDADPRLFALRHWPNRVFSATVDQFFAFMSYGYGPMCLLPVLADSVIVVDEVHSFDRAMFSALLGFLEAFDVPVLCMTATLQTGRKEQLKPLMEQVYEDRPGELAQIANAGRYKIARIDEAAGEQKVRDAVAAGKRVLWVVNQVSRAQSIALKLSNIGVPLICYHSRFKLADRVNRHRETLNTIIAGQPAAVVISTQVCEMSLDIDADVLITEECPISSLIQRMGRCRRGRNELAMKGPGEVFIYQPAEEWVYSKDDLAELQDFLAFLQAKPAVSQTDLEQGLEKYGRKTAEAPKLNSFLSSGAYAFGGEDSFRDIEAFNIPAVLSSDVAKYLSANKDIQPGFIVPVPRKLKPAEDPRLPRYLRVADERNYDPTTGFWDKPLR